MPEKWTGELVGKMHLYGVRQADLAKVAGVTRAYVSMILAGKRTPAGGREKLEDAFARCIGEVEA